MARNSEKIIQLLRSSNIYTPTIEEGVQTKSALENAIDSFNEAFVLAAEPKDGEIMLARYQETGEKVKAVLAAYTDKGENDKGFTFYIDSVAINEMVQELSDKIDSIETKTTVEASDKSMNVNVDAANGTGISVNVDWENEKVLKLGENGIHTDLNIVKVIPTGEASEGVIVDDGLNENVREAYRLMSGNEQIGQQIDIYKDSALKEIWLGSEFDMTDAITGAITKYAWQSKLDASNHITNEAYQSLDEPSKANYEPLDLQSLNYVYQLANGSYSLVKVDVSKFLADSEFGDGLQVSNGVVSVKKDPASESYLTVSADGVKISGIDSAIATETTRAQSAEDEIANLVGLTGTEGNRSWNPTTNYGAGALSARDNMESIATALSGVIAQVSGIAYLPSDAISVTQSKEEGHDNEYTIALELSEESDNVLEIKTNGNKGLYLSNVWDCGEYSVETVEP